MTYSYLIIDDDAAFTIRLQKKLESFAELKYLHSFHDSISSFRGIKDFNPDIIFLDINIDTFNVLEQLSTPPVKACHHIDLQRCTNRKQHTRRCLWICT